MNNNIFLASTQGWSTVLNNVRFPITFGELIAEFGIDPGFKYQAFLGYEIVNGVNTPRNVAISQESVLVNPCFISFTQAQMKGAAEQLSHNELYERLTQLRNEGNTQIPINLTNMSRSTRQALYDQVTSTVRQAVAPLVVNASKTEESAPASNVDFTEAVNVINGILREQAEQIARIENELTRKIGEVSTAIEALKNSQDFAEQMNVLGRIFESLTTIKLHLGLYGDADVQNALS